MVLSKYNNMKSSAPNSANAEITEKCKNFIK